MILYSEKNIAETIKGIKLAIIPILTPRKNPLTDGGRLKQMNKTKSVNT